MGKSKRRKAPKNNSSRVYPSSKKTSRPIRASSTPRASAHPARPATPPTIPFDPSHRILLVGEGNFSFAHSLLVQHACTSLVPTCLDTPAELVHKYPQAAAHISALEHEDEVKVLYGVDATKLQKGGKEVRKGAFDRIVFNFPHVGGLTKDVNRQVRYNQELLVGFFKSATPLLAPGGSIVLTVFEGEPYELWNVRDLARHVGLKVGRSFRFQADAYPAYEHARTIGNITGGGGWKGEDRAARTYIIELKDGEEVQGKMGKRKRGDSDEDDD
ncbi:hypothetical protein MMC22_000021 [Lobaria immixta]|nr:hypothetical protein [Lobaria immixta]